MKDKNPKPVSTPDTHPTEERVAAKSEWRTLSRRDFLKVAGVTMAVVAVGAGGVTVVKTLTQGQLEGLKAAMVRILTRQYGEAKGQILDQKIQQELENALTQLPYIGTSQENKWADNMPSAAFALAAYRVLVPEYATPDEAGHILYETLQLDMSGLTSVVMKTTYNEEAIIEKLKALAARSQKRQYPEDWA